MWDALGRQEVVLESMVAGLLQGGREVVLEGIVTEMVRCYASMWARGSLIEGMKFEMVRC